MWLSSSFVRLFAAYAALIVGFVVVATWIAAGEPNSQKTGQLWGAAAVALVLGLGTTWYGIQQIVSPLVQLTRDVRRQAAADDDKAIPAVEGDEMGVLSAAFSQIQQKLAQRVDQLQGNTEQLQTVLGSMIEGVLAVSPDKSILLANEAGRYLLDFVTADPTGRPLLEVTRARPVYEAVVEALASSEPVQREFESPGKQRRTLAMRATRLRGEPTPGVIVVLHDVSDLRRLENLRREFVAGVSHELKTPLAAIKAYAETLRMGAVNDPENNLNFVLRIEEQAERLHQLILDLLQIARMEAGQEVFEIADVYLTEVLDECQLQYADAATAKQITLEVILPEDKDLAARCDEEGIRTILSNLVDNAIKYTPVGGKVTVRCQPCASTSLANQPAVCIHVQDTGIGIAEKDQARVFERFFRVDKARSRELGGTGLGLSIVKHFVQAFGGSVSVESQLKQGSTFRVELPRGVVE